MGVYRSTKTFTGLSCAHRRWRHEGHCAFVHGYDRRVTIEFGAHNRDENGFVMDFGALRPIKSWLEGKFDHTLLLDEDDPLLPDFKGLEARGACKLVTFKDVGMEGSAQYICDFVSQWLVEHTDDRVYVVSVEVAENLKNSGKYLNRTV
jgi:6-pyruvoyltetrahydropterin/6-carboxytetrahydropterin synthase